MPEGKLIKRSKNRAKENGDRNGAIASTNGASVSLSRVSDALGALRISPEQLRAFVSSPGSDEEPWDVLLAMLATDEQTALKKFSDRTGLQFDPEPRLAESSQRFYELISPSFARERHVAGLRADGHVLTVATAQPMQPATFSAIEDIVQMPVDLVLSPRAAVANLINRGFEQRQDLVTEIIEEMPLDERAISQAAGSVGSGNDLLALARQTPVIRLVNMILFEALRRRASDVHIHPHENKLEIRYRVDGMLVEAFSPPLSLAPAISSRLKVMTELDIANRHSPQDGHTTVRIGSHKVDIRLSVIPTVYGERIVLRLLDQTQTELSLDEVGMTDEMQDTLRHLVDHPNGIILVTGPTGSGKTTTLYAALGQVDRSSRNVMTIEDPVEYHLEGISQMQVNPKRGVTFATGLRSLLRQDPDVILVGEIRDPETAQLAIQASLTGHLVLSTLHTNDAPSAIPRLIDIGVPSYLVTSSLLAVLAQRLLRRVCVSCHGTGKSAAPSAHDDRCEVCFGTGYKGRLAVYEVMKLNDTLRRVIGQSADAITIANAAEAEGFHTMIEDARKKASNGLTTEAEIMRVLRS
ncbi:MAG: type II/IV secretion system protein [Phycisphaeraceae bacterium]|nr:type II/IV secretion system protein [Phycisphaerales bacterium]MCB9859785.1 type II/IV secretion system protein [Phycisphaeraceae bacterium]